MRNWKMWTLAAVVAGAWLVSLLAVRAAAVSTKVPTLTGQDYAEIQQLLNKYMFALDACDQGKPYNYADLYTTDGSFGSGNAARPPAEPTRGREGLSRYGQHPDGSCSPSGVRGLQNAFHFNIAPIIEPSPEGAKGKSYLLMLHTPMGQIRYAGWYDDVYAKTPAGWRFKSRYHHTDYSILYDSRVPGYDQEPGVNRGPGRGQEQPSGRQGR